MHVLHLKSKLISAWEINTTWSSLNNNEQRQKILDLHARADQLFETLSGLQRRIQSKTDKHLYRWMAFTGFGHKTIRDAVVCCLRYFFKPRFLHSSIVDQEGYRWEGLMGVWLPTEIDVDQMCEAFAASMTFIDIEQCFNEPMLACLDRIERGTNFLGNYFTKKTANFRAMYARALQERRDQREREAARQVHLVTGIRFTPENMLSMYTEYQNNLSSWRHQHNTNIRESRAHLEFVNGHLERLQANLNQITNDLNLAHSTSRSDADEGFISSLQSQLEHIVRDLETLRNSRSNFFYTRPVA